jgi:hypothetical protein
VSHIKAQRLAWIGYMERMQEGEVTQRSCGGDQYPPDQGEDQK